MPKNSIEAVDYLLHGDRLFGERRFCEALLAYNHCLCLLESVTQLVSMCYAKRSMVYYDLKEYELCLANIELARQDCWHPLKTSLDYLKTKCEQFLESDQHAPDDDPMNFFKLSYPAKTTLPCLSNCLKLRVNKKFGRHIISGRDLNVGDIVAVTEFSFILFDKRARLHHCSHCIKSSMKLSLIPCRGCDKAMYCSVDCMKKDKRKFHQYECNIHDNPVDQYMHFKPLKIFVHILDQFDGNVDEMKNFLDANRCPSTVFDFDFSDKDDPMFEKNMILATLSMRNAVDFPQGLRDYCLRTHHRFIKKHPKLMSLWTSPNKKYLDELLCKLFDVLDVKGGVSCFVEVDMNLKEDGYDLNDARTTPQKLDNTYINKVADVIDPYMSLLNLHCYPNLSLKFVNNKQVWIVTRPVKAGEQLFLYRGPGAKYTSMPLQRQPWLLKQFGFQCDCEGCLMNWPTFLDMKKLADAERLSTSLEVLGISPRRDEQQSKEWNEYWYYAAKIQAMDMYYPCRDSVNFETKWIRALYRLVQPAKWFTSTKSVSD